MNKENFVEGLKYPWNKPSRLWNILWILIPIIGYLAIMGYVKKVIVELAKGNKKELPKFGKFWDNLSVGFMLFVYMIPTYVVLWIISEIPFIGRIAYFLVAIFVLPWLMINLYVKGEFNALWDLKGVYEAVTSRFMEYVIALLKTIGFMFIYGIASIVLIGIPCLTFGSMYYLTDFYKKK
jgi:hypothetical protein